MPLSAVSGSRAEGMDVNTQCVKRGHFTRCYGELSYQRCGEPAQIQLPVRFVCLIDKEFKMLFLFSVNNLFHSAFNGNVGHEKAATDQALFYAYLENIIGRMFCT